MRGHLMDRGKLRPTSKLEVDFDLEWNRSTLSMVQFVLGFQLTLACNKVS